MRKRRITIMLIIMFLLTSSYDCSWAKTFIQNSSGSFEVLTEANEFQADQKTDKPLNSETAEESPIESCEPFMELERFTSEPEMSAEESEGSSSDSKGSDIASEELSIESEISSTESEELSIESEISSTESEELSIESEISSTESEESFTETEKSTPYPEGPSEIQESELINETQESIQETKVKETSEEISDKIRESLESENIQETESKGLEKSELIAEGEEIGNYAVVEHVRRVVRTTGTEPWDSDESAGNDKSKDDDIVRTFDQIHYDFELTMGIKKGNSITKVYGGKIGVEAELPENIDVEWDESAFQWMSDLQISADKKKIQGYYRIHSSVQSAPGSQTLSFQINVKACANKDNFQPVFKFYLEGNQLSEYQTYTDTPVTVSAFPRYNIELVWDKGTPAYKGIEVDLDGERNKLYNVGVGFQLYGENAQKGIKGVELPSGELSFDVNVSLLRKAHEEDESGTDITEGNVRFLSAKPNTMQIKKGDLSSPQYEVLLNDIPTYAKFSTHQPLSAGPEVYQKEDRSRHIYHNGIYTITEKNNQLHICISDYEIDGVFPYRWGSSAAESEHNFQDNIGYISVANLFYTVALNEETFGAADSNCYLYFWAENPSVQSLSGQAGIMDMVPSDNQLSTMHVEYTKGQMSTANFSYTVSLSNKKVHGTMIQSEFTNGDGRALPGSDIVLMSEISLGASNPLTYAGYYIDVLCKFDDEGFEPILYEDGSEYVMYDEWTNYSEEVQFNLLYAGKTDKSGWRSDQEMMNAPMSELVYFDTMKELKDAGYICVGVAYESKSGILKPGKTAKLCVPVHIKKTAVKDQVYQFMENVRIWGKDQKIDRSVQTLLNPNASYPEAIFNWKPIYQKTVYDKNGSIVGGHDPGYKEGNSMLMIGGMTSITKSVMDQTEEEKEKTVYDLKNGEDIVSYILYPSFYAESSLIEGITVKDTVKIYDYLPKGLTYLKGSSSYGEPEITELEDGNVKLTWNILDWNINTEKEPISYQAEIDKTSLSGTQYMNKAVIHAPNTDNSSEGFRTDSYTITIVNLAGHRIFKEVMEEHIETDGMLQYRLNYLNLTEQQVNGAVILDILPYNGDSRNTQFHGDYQVKELLPTKKKEGTHYQVYGNTSVDIRSSDGTGIDVKDGSWILIGDEKEKISVNKKLTALCIIGDFEPYEEMELDIRLEPENCRGGDAYYNDFMMQVSGESTVIRAVPVRIDVTERMITVTKQIPMNDIYLPFGDPSFCFCLEGTTGEGKPLKLFRILEFTQEVVKNNTGSDGYVRLDTVFEGLPPGEYILKERPTLRYSFKDISEVSSNGTIQGETVLFELQTENQGSATFTNEIKRWDHLTHTTSVVNQIAASQ